jgi:hypothetical protein
MYLLFGLRLKLKPWVFDGWSLHTTQGKFGLEIDHMIIFSRIGIELIFGVNLEHLFEPRFASIVK